ncbi:MAG: (2Fe-2S)-binding protein [Desulfatirhabdiaceae bacterium]
MKNVITLTINGTPVELLISPNATLAQVLRGKQLNLTGTKQACELGDCGACTVIMDGKAVNSCLVLAMQADGSEITTVEGLAVDGKLSPIQESFIDAGAIQCGFCSSGMMMSAKAMLDQNPSPSRDEIRHGIAGNLCRCTGYYKIVNAIENTAKRCCQEGGA